MKKFVTVVVMCFVLAFAMSATACSEKNYRETYASTIIDVSTAQLDERARELGWTIEDSFISGRSGVYYYNIVSEGELHSFEFERPDLTTEKYFYNDSDVRNRYRLKLYCNGTLCSARLEEAEYY